MHHTCATFRTNSAELGTYFNTVELAGRRAVHDPARLPPSLIGSLAGATVKEKCMSYAIIGFGKSSPATIWISPASYQSLCLTMPRSCRSTLRHQTWLR